MHLVDVRRLPPDTRTAAADQIRVLPDFALPPLRYFNSDPCPEHTSIDDGAAQVPPCRRCGIRLRRHQRVGVAWLYMRGKGLIADQVGTGKTAQAAGLIACCKQAGELDNACAVIVVRPSVLCQWVAELRRFLPDLTIAAATGTREERRRRYTRRFDILVTGYPILVRDLELLDELPTRLLVVDDIDPLRHTANSTSYAIKRIARHSERCVVLTATPLQKKLLELHSVLEPVGGADVFGGVTHFRRCYIKEELVRVYNPRAGRPVQVRETVGYQHPADLKLRLAPMVLRRTPDDITDVDLPVLAPPNNVYLDLYPDQQKRYDLLRKGVLAIIHDEGAEVRHTKAAVQFLYGAQICAGLATLGEADGPKASSKLDWVLDRLTGDLESEKVVIFCQFQNTVAALQQRLLRHGIGHVTIWGREQDRTVRDKAKEAFWSDPRTRVLIGTTAIEQGHNLQVARHLRCIDQIMNPARMTQLAGRIRRDGSAYRTVYIHNLLARGTHEAGLLDLLAREQALADHVWHESNQLYEALPPLALLEMIGKA